MSLAQLTLGRSAKMMERLEAIEKLFYNLYKNPTSTMAGFVEKTIMSPNLKSLKDICVTLMLQTFETVCVFQTIILKI